MTAGNPRPPSAGRSDGTAAERPRILVFIVDGAQDGAHRPAAGEGESLDAAGLDALYDITLVTIPDAAHLSLDRVRAALVEPPAARSMDCIAVLYGADDLARRIEALVRPVLDRAGDIAFAPAAAGGAAQGRSLRARALHLAFWPLRDAFDPTRQSFALSAQIFAALPASAAAAAGDLALAVLVHGGGLRAVEAPEAASHAAPAALGHEPASWHEVASRIRQAAALSGALLSSGTAARFSAVGLIAMAFDLTLFKIFLLLHFGLSAAHISSFALSALLNFQLNARWTFEAAGRRSGRSLWRQYARFLAVALLALALRGGFLGLATMTFGLPPLIGILFGIGAAASVSFLGNAFFVFPTMKIRTTLPWRLAAVGALAFGLLLRLVYIGQIPLLPEEAYYWEYARHLDIGYLDHPPMVAWAIALATHILGTNEFAVRLSALAAGLATVVCQYLYGRRLHGKSAALVTVLLLSVLPYYFSAATIMSPDALLVAAWAGTLLFLERALLAGRAGAWIGAGLCLGLGMLSKYTIALLGPAALLFVLLDPRSRRWLARPEPYLAILAAGILFAPVVAWNAGHGWASFVFQGPRRLESSLTFGLPALIGDVLVLLTPLGAAAAFLALRRRPEDEAGIRRRRFQTVFTLVPLGVFVAFSLTHEVKPNWTGPLWLALLPAIAAECLPAARPLSGSAARALQRSWKPVLVALFLAYGVTFHYLTLGLPGIGYPHSLHGLPVSWPDLAREAAAEGAEIAGRTGSQPVYVGLDKYDFASEIAFYSLRDGNRPAAVAGAGLFGGTGLMFDRWRDAATLVGKPLLLLAFHRRDLQAPAIAAHCTRLGPIQPVTARRLGKRAGRYFQRLCIGYRRAPAKD